MAPMKQFGSRRNDGLPAFAEAVAEEILQVVDGVNLLDRRLDVVLDAAVADRLVVEQDVAGPPVAVARLADRADVAQRLAAVEAVDVLNLVGAVELEALGKDARHVRVPLEAVAVHQGEDALHLPLVVDVLGEDVLVERVAGRAVDVQEAVLAEAARAFGQELPALLAGLAALAGRLELVARPEDGPLGGRVEALGVEHGAL